MLILFTSFCYHIANERVFERVSHMVAKTMWAMRMLVRCERCERCFQFELIIFKVGPFCKFLYGPAKVDLAAAKCECFEIDNYWWKTGQVVEIQYLFYNICWFLHELFHMYFIGEFYHHTNANAHSLIGEAIAWRWAKEERNEHPNEGNVGKKAPFLVPYP